MRNRFKLITITVRCSLLLFIVPLFIAYLALPLLYASICAIDDVDYVAQRMFYLAQIFICVSCILWPMAYLQIRIGSESQETIRSCQIGKSSCVFELILLEVVFLFTLVPFAGISSTIWGFRVFEYLRLLSQITFVYGALYFVSILLQSVSMSGMIVVSYLLFSVLFTENKALTRICIIRDSLITADDMLIQYVPVFILAIIFYMLGDYCEKRYTPK